MKKNCWWLTYHSNDISFSGFLKVTYFKSEPVYRGKSMTYLCSDIDRYKLHLKGVNLPQV